MEAAAIGGVQAVAVDSAWFDANSEGKMSVLRACTDTWRTPAGFRAFSGSRNYGCVTNPTEGGEAKAQSLSVN